MILTLTIFAVLNVILAFIDSRIIRNKKEIKHWMNGLIYCALAGAVYLFFIKDLFFIAALFLERLIFFQIGLSLFRGLDWDYMTSTPHSVTDKIQVKVLGDNGLVVYSIYGLLFIGLLFKIFL